MLISLWITGEAGMGEKITRPPKSTEQARAKFLREALHHSTPTLSIPHSEEIPQEHINSELSGEWQKAYLEELIECAPEAISMLDNTCRVVRINTEFTRVFGYKPDEVAGRRLDSLVIPPDR